VIARAELTLFLHDYLACATFNDYAPNGLQIEGRASIQRICTAVTASQTAIQYALSMDADALLVHHGYFWKGEDPVITGMKRQRIGQLISNDINLYAYHLPLDCHLELGNNACLGRLFAAQKIQTYTAANTVNLLWTGTLTKSLSADQLSAYLHQVLQQQPLHMGDTNKPISSIAWCSGAAEDLIVDAHALGVDAYLSGETSERTYYQAQELGIHYFACGHHATERHGIQALGNYLATRFGLEHQFFDSDNPI
jgi:dinuclear metal center YbgI/SA1388 family protein